MAIRKSTNDSSDREKKWDKVFSALVKLSRNLNKDRQLLEEKIKSLNEKIYQMKMEQKVESAKVELLLGLKERDAFIYKIRYENVGDELEDFREWFNYLSEKVSGSKDDVSNKRNKTLLDEVRRLKSELEKCKLEKKSEISALLDEKKFVWNQYKKMDSDFTEQLKKKCDEVEYANEKVKLLVNRAEELQLSNERLKIDLASVESDSLQKSHEISRLLKEIELLKSRSESETPVLHRCTAGMGALDKQGKNRVIGRSAVTVKKESDPSHSFQKMAPAKRSAHKSTGGKVPKKQLGSKGSGSLKRKAADIITIPDDTPKLFTSSFKVPKLKPSSSPQVV